MPFRATRRHLVLVLAPLAAACPGAGRSGGRGAALDDSSYVHVMAELRQVLSDRLAHPPPPLPPMVKPGQVATEAQRREREALDAKRRDSVAAVDSATRAAILARRQVTLDQLLATAELLAEDPAHAQKVTEAISRRGASLDSAARAKERQATLDSATRAAAARDSAKGAAKR